MCVRPIERSFGPGRVECDIHSCVGNSTTDENLPMARVLIRVRNRRHESISEAPPPRNKRNVFPLNSLRIASLSASGVTGSEICSQE
jgi:hypothetical protein